MFAGMLKETGLSKLAVPELAALAEEPPARFSARRRSALSLHGHLSETNLRLSPCNHCVVVYVVVSPCSITATCMLLVCCFICLSFACGSVLLHVSLYVLFVIVVLIHVVSSMFFC